MAVRTLGALFGPLCKTYDDFVTLRLVATSSGRVPRCKGLTLSSELLSILGGSECRMGLRAMLHLQPQLAQLSWGDLQEVLRKQEGKAIHYKTF